MQDLERVHDYYCSVRSTSKGAESVYEIWEKGEAFNDSITPSTYVPEYRSHIVLKILTLAEEKSNILSIGCGNGFVEGDLIENGHAVKAIDCNVEAVKLANAKGVDAFVLDFFDLEPSHVSSIDITYADGVFGHLFDSQNEMKPTLDKLANLRLRPGSWIVVSNDSPRTAGVPFEAHDRVEGFWFISREYLRDSLASFGFEPVESYYFPYRRPMSGMRNRTICVARVR
jgi:SAM-dependent methyltransferase